MSHGQLQYFASKDMPHGRTYGSWTVEWWQWILEIPKPVNPIIDLTGEYTENSQDNAEVFFLAGKLAEEEGELPRRICTVSAGKSILIPVINCESNPLEYPELGTDEDIIERARSDENTITIAECYIDGEAVPKGQGIQRIASDPLIFPVNMVGDNLFGVKNGGVTRASADGYWVFLKPLSRGNHVVSFRGSCENGRLHSGAIYEVNVE